MAFFVSCSALFWPFSLYLLLPAFGCFSLWLVFLRFFGFCLYFCTPGFFRFFCQFLYRIICLCVQCPFYSASCIFHFWPLLLFVAFGITRFCSFGPSWTACTAVCSCLCLVFVAVIQALFSVIIRFSVACVVGVIRFPGCLVFFQWLGCLVFSVARVSGVCSCSCVKRFQLLVCRALSVARSARVPSALGCSCVERSQLIVGRALSVNRMSSALS